MEEIKDFNVNYFYYKPIVGNFLKIYDVVSLAETFYLLNIQFIAKFEIKDDDEKFSIVAYPIKNYNINSEINDYVNIYGIKDFDDINEAHTVLKLISNYLDN